MTSAITRTELSTALKLYGYNPCSVKYDTTTRSSVLDTSYNWSTDADLGTALDLATLYPQDEIVKYGTKLTFAGPWSAWCEDAGKTRCVSSTPGVYATAGASGSPDPFSDHQGQHDGLRRLALERLRRRHERTVVADID